MFQEKVDVFSSSLLGLSVTFVNADRARRAWKQPAATCRNYFIAADDVKLPPNYVERAGCCAEVDRSIHLHKNRNVSDSINPLKTFHGYLRYAVSRRA